MGKEISFLGYEYPDLIRIRLKGVTYTYQSSHFFCQRFMGCWLKGGRFNTLNWFKRVSKVVGKEVGR